MANCELDHPKRLGKTVVLGYCDIAQAGIREFVLWKGCSVGSTAVVVVVALCVPAAVACGIHPCPSEHNFFTPPPIKCYTQDAASTMFVFPRPSGISVICTPLPRKKKNWDLTVPCRPHIYALKEPVTKAGESNWGRQNPWGFHAKRFSREAAAGACSTDAQSSLPHHSAFTWIHTSNMSTLYDGGM